MSMMYPKEECAMCGKVYPVVFMGLIEGKHPLCYEHYLMVVESHGVMATLKQLEEDDTRTKSLKGYFTGFVNKVAKHEVAHNKKLIDKVVLEHKRLIKERHRNVDTILVNENNEIVSYLNNDYLKSLVPFVLNKEDLLKVKLKKSYYSVYYEKLTGRKSKRIGVSPWLL